MKASQPSSVLAAKEIRDEMASLKGLLLNRHQFPTPTNSHVSTVMGIPSWQRTPLGQKTDDEVAVVSGGDGDEEEGEGEGEGESERVAKEEKETEK